MWFLFGLFVGASLAGGSGSPMHSMVAQIPLRCFAALDISEAEYRTCRMPTMFRELNEATRYGSDPVCMYVWLKHERFDRDMKATVIDRVRESCDVDRALTLELKALAELKRLAEANQQSQAVR